jgi:hypothetical protein
MVSLFAIEAGATFLVLAFALATPRLGSRWFQRAGTLLERVARRKGAAILLVGCASLLGRLAILPWDPIPQPFVHDEFSYLLAADTFASGRLTNPTPPMWEHFESFHVDQYPTYMSMYFPAQGLVLAAGKRLFRHPWFGVWLSCGVMCAVTCWMLQGWLPPGWALIGGLLLVIRIGMFSYWMDSYYGGAVQAIGGALVLGAFPRLIGRRTPLLGLALVAGFAILGASRPWEGAWLGAGVVLAALLQLRRSPVPLPSPRFWMPALMVGLAAAAAMGYYNWRLTGDPLTVPYQVNRGTYAVAPFFVWQELRPEPVYRHKEMRTFYVEQEEGQFLRIKSFWGFIKEAVRKIGSASAFFFAAALLPPLMMLPKVVTDRRLRSLLVIAAVYSLGLVVNAWFFPHYAAPVTAIFYAVLIQCLRHLRTVNVMGMPSGRFVVRMTVVVCLLTAGLRLAAQPLQLRIERLPYLWYGTMPVGLARAKVASDMGARSRKQLLIVRYTSNHDPLDEWVYNDADIDAAKIVWAREMSPERNRELVDYFHDREVWLVEPDSGPPVVVPYVLPGREVSK